MKHDNLVVVVFVRGICKWSHALRLTYILLTCTFRRLAKGCGHLPWPLSPFKPGKIVKINMEEIENSMDSKDIEDDKNAQKPLTGNYM